MKIKKYLGNLVVLFIATSICLTFNSCSKDDEDSVQNQLVGVWKTSMSSSNWKVIEIKADGTLLDAIAIRKDGTTYYWGDGTPLYWIYNETDKTIRMYQRNNYYNYVFVVSMAKDGNSWNGHDSSNGKTYSFVRHIVPNQ